MNGISTSATVEARAGYALNQGFRTTLMQSSFLNSWRNYASAATVTGRVN